MYLVPGAFQRAGDEHTDGLIVLNDQKLCHGQDSDGQKLILPNPAW
jgi:hypothetical protein